MTRRAIVPAVLGAWLLAGIGLHYLLRPTVVPKGAKPPPPGWAPTPTARTGDRYFDAAVDLHAPDLMRFFELDPGEGRFAAGGERGRELREEFRRVLRIELSDADLERIRRETELAWRRRKQGAKELIDEYLAGRLDAAETVRRGRELYLRHSQDDFRRAAEISEGQLELLQEDLLERSGPF